MLTNTGLKSDTASNTITVTLTATVMPDTNKVDELVYVTAGVKYSDYIIWVGQTEVTVRATGDQPQPAQVCVNKRYQFVNSGNDPNINYQFSDQLK